MPLTWLVLVWGAGALTQSLGLELSVILGREAEHHVHFLILKKATEFDVAFFETPEYYDKLENALLETPRAYTFSVSTFHVMSQLLSLVALLGMLYQLHPVAVGVVVITSIPQAFLLGYYADRWWHVATDFIRNRRIATYLSRLLTAGTAAKEIRSFGLNSSLLERYATIWESFLSDQKRVRYAKEKFNILLGSLSILGTVAIWVYAISQTVVQKITFGQLALYFQAAGQSRDRVVALVGRCASFYEHALFSRNLFDFLDLKLDAVPGALESYGMNGRKKLTVPNPISKGIEFQNVSFVYPGTGRMALENLSFRLPAGETIAVVGANGAGKTTLVKLLTRFYDPTEGRILLDGHDVREYDLVQLRQQFGAIFQDFIRYDFTVRENIGFGQVDEIDNTSRIAWAAERAGVADTINRLSKQYDTPLGREFEGAEDLSGGEWQKIALSRAYMRRAQILILDEPTSSLDAIAEYETFKNLSRLTEGKTTIFISHRFSTVRSATLILTLDRGRLVEQGSHTALIDLNGLYARMFKLQADRYK